MRPSGKAALAFAVFVGPAAACLPTVVFDCADDHQCEGLAADARCEPVGYCSAPDDACESGRRFHDHAGDGLASTCTPRGGQEIWTRTYTSPGFFEDRAYHLAIDGKGDIVVIGHTTVAGQGFNVWVRKYSGDGDERWTWVLDGGANLDEEGWSVVALPNDELVVAGYVTTPGGGPDIWAAGLTADGLRTWELRRDGGLAELDEARDVAIADDGDLVLIGYVTADDATLGTELWYERSDPQGQVVRWSRTRPGFVDYGSDRAHGIAALGDDFVGVGFRQNDDGTQTWPWIARFDAQGNDVWNDDGTDVARGGIWTAVEALPDGNIVVGGQRPSEQGDDDAWLQIRGPDGGLVWEEFVASPGGSDDRVNAIFVDDQGGFIVGGELGAGAGSTDAWLRRYDARRNELWSTTYSGPAGERDTVWGVGVDPDGNVVACGYGSTPETGWDIWVRKYTP